MKNIAIFASGEGTNAERIVRYFLENSTIKVAIIITNKPNAGVIKRAKSLGIHTAFLTKEELQGERIMERRLSGNEQCT